MGWNGTCPVLYWSFDNADGLVIMEETTRVNFDSLVPGKVIMNKFTTEEQNLLITFYYDILMFAERKPRYIDLCGQLILVQLF